MNKIQSKSKAKMMKECSKITKESKSKSKMKRWESKLKKMSKVNKSIKTKNKNSNSQIMEKAK